jgi:hypothetical protein
VNVAPRRAADRGASSSAAATEAEISPCPGGSPRAGPFAGPIADDCHRRAGQRRTTPNDSPKVRRPRLRRSAGRWRVGLYAGFCSGASAPWSGSRPRRPSLSAGGCPTALAAYPGVSADGPSSPCVALLPVGFAEPPGSPRALVRSYRTVSPLPVRDRSGDRSRHRRLFSVALSCGLPRLGVTQHRARWSPDVPRTGTEAPGTRPPGRLATTSIVAPEPASSQRNRRPA